MKNKKVYIENALPQTIKNILADVIKNSGFKSVVDKENADILFRYAHDRARQMRLEPLDEFNKNITGYRNKKTVFFSWFDLYNPEDESFFEDYFTPAKPNIWNMEICRFAQLPASEEHIRQLLMDFKLIDHA